MLTGKRRLSRRFVTGKWLAIGCLTTCLTSQSAAAQEFIDPATLNSAAPATRPVEDSRAAALAGGPRRVNGLVNGSLEQAAALLQRGQLVPAVALYRQLVNTANEGQRAQARYGLAYALDQQGQDRAALEVLSTMPTDPSPVGQALADLRGKIILQLAEAAWWGTDPSAGTGTTGVSSWLAQYDRLTVQPDPDRAQRLRSYLLQSSDLNDPAARAHLTVAVLVPLSGPLAPVGNALLQGLELGIAARSQQGGSQVVLKPLDTAAAGGAGGAAQAALSQNASIVVGPLRAAEVVAAAAILQPAGVPVLSFSTDARVSAPGVWSAAFTPTAQAEKLVEPVFSATDGQQRVAGLVPDNAYGHGAWNVFAKAVLAHGGTVSGVSFFAPDQTDLAVNLKTLTGSGQAVAADHLPFDALFLPVPAGSLPLITAQLTAAGVTQPAVKLLGTALWQDPVLLTAAGAGDLHAGIFAAPGQTPVFEALYRATYAPPAAGAVLASATPVSETSLATANPTGITPATVLLASQGEDVGRMLADIAVLKPRLGLENGGLPGSPAHAVDITPLLTRPAGFPGQAGYLQLKPNGQSIRGQALVTVGRTVVDPVTKLLTFRVITPALPLAPLPLPDTLLPPVGDRGKLW